MIALSDIAVKHNEPMTDDTFGDWLRVQMARRGFSQTELAERVGTTQSVVSRWVRNERVPDPSSCDRIADALGLDIDVVLAAAGHRPNIEDVDVYSVEAEMVGLPVSAPSEAE